MNKNKQTAVLIALATLLALSALSIRIAPAAEDTRELVEMPQMMQQHMLSNMREHLITLDKMLAALAKGDTDETAKLAESRLGMSSLSLHGAEHMARFMPDAMRAFGSQMHHAASRFAIIARDAELEEGTAAHRKVYDALHAITQNCNGCHQAYRIR